MHYRLLGRTGLYVSEVCLGAMTYGGKGRWEVVGTLGLPEVQAQIKYAFDAWMPCVPSRKITAFR
jgi:aryl-alcohol dehydrogenase-like predicted oxidoreductase